MPQRKRKHRWPSAGFTGSKRNQFLPHDGTSEACSLCGLHRRWTLRPRVAAYEYLTKGVWLPARQAPGCPGRPAQDGDSSPTHRRVFHFPPSPGSLPYAAEFPNLGRVECSTLDDLIELVLEFKKRNLVA